MRDRESARGCIMSHGPWQCLELNTLIMTSRIEGRTVTTLFDCTCLQSTVPFKLLPGSNSIGEFVSLLVTVDCELQSFSCVQRFLISMESHVVLGLDWFAYYHEHFVSGGLPPPHVDSFSLAMGK